MIQVADNFNYRGKKPNFDRDSFDTLQDMKNYSENSLDDGHISYCKETDKRYKFNSNNQSDPTTGKWVEQHEAVPADEEDITEQNGTLQLANKTYDKQSFSGLGRVYLRKNIVGDKNVLTQAMINKANTIYVIQYDYDLKEASINIPENCVLQFDGGSLSNGTIVGNNTKIKTELEKIFNNITIDGNWNVVEAHPEWFGALPDGIYDCTDAIQKTINSFDVTKLNNGVYFINGTIQLRSHVVIFGEIGTKTYDKFGNELTWSKSDWLNPDGSLVTKVIFASRLNDFTKNNTIYNIVRYIDLKGETLTIPENSVLNFIGGAIGNGTIIGNKTKVINLNVDRIILSGTWFDSGITSNRPTNVLVGFQYFDTTVNKPIFWDGSKWIDATGATV